MEQMYDKSYDQMVEAKVAIYLAKPVYYDKEDNEVSDDEEGTQLQSGGLFAAAKSFDKEWSSIRKIWILAKSNCENPEKEWLLVVIVVWLSYSTYR